MRRIRLVATDVDGTLLDPQGCVTPRTLGAIRALADAGVVVALATGRRWTGASLVAASLNFQGPVIHMDGAVIRSYPDGAMLHSSPLDRAIAQSISEGMVSYGIQPIVQYADHVADYLHVTEEAAHPEWTAAYISAFRHQVRSLPLARLCDVAVDPIRVVAFAPLPVLRRVAVDLASPLCGRQLLLNGAYGDAELTMFSSAVSKGEALVILARQLGIPLEETLAIGDESNDISMLRAAGFAVAMGQAPRQVRAAADVVTGSNAQDGLADALERYALGYSFMPLRQ